MKKTVGVKIGSTFLVMALLVLISGGAGIISTQSLTNSLRFVSGPAWDSADGAMEGTIGIQNELINMKLVLTQTIPLQQGQAQIKEASAFSDEALARMTGSFLISQHETQSLQRNLSTFRNGRDQLLIAFAEQLALQKKTEQNADKLDQLLGGLEDQIEEKLDAGNFQRFSYRELEALWESADATMETRIGLLNAQSALKNLTSGSAADQQLRTINDGLALAKEQSTALAKTAYGRQQRPGHSDSYGDAIKRTVATQVQLIEQAIERFNSFAVLKKQVDQQTYTLLQQLEQLEEIGDSTVENEISNIDSVVKTADITIIVTLAFGLLVALLSYLFVVRYLVQPLQQVADNLKDISEGDGDLTVRLPIKGEDELAQLATGFNGFVEKTGQLIHQVSTATEELKHNADSLSHSSTETNSVVQSQQQELSQIATAMSQMSSAAQEVANSASSASKSAVEADNLAQSGQKVMQDASAAIDAMASEIDQAVSVVHQLKEESSGIEGVLDVIRDIADQTNLLALNAAIEAARAGETGRGFAVVADEVRTLASRTQNSTQEIHDMIERLQRGTEQAVQTMALSQQHVQSGLEKIGSASDTLRHITHSVDTINDMNAAIAGSAEEQHSVVHTVSETIDTIASASGNTAQSTEQVQAISEESAQLSGRLQGLISQFRV